VHELGICEDVLRAVERRADGRRVAAIGVRTGVLLRVVPDAFRQSFELVAAGGIAADADVELTVVPVTVTCSACGSIAESDDAVPVCPSCGGGDVATSGGDELVLEWLRYRETADAS
jgi:hydrogenase nickel incorporation protein HypA/HybF